MKNKFNIRSLLIGVLFVALIFITRAQSDAATVAYILIFIFCARDVDFNGIVHFSAWAILLTLLFVIASAYIGVIPNNISYGSRVRHYLGFRYSTYAPQLLFNITGLFIYLKKGNIRWLSLMALTFFNSWMYFMTRSRLSFILSIVLILAAGFLKIFPDFFKHKRISCMIMVFSFVLGFCISIFATISYNPSVSWQRQLNSILENRLSLGQSAFQEYGVSLFGQQIKLVGYGLDQFGMRNTTDEYNYVDSFYEQILLRYGVVFTIIWIGLLTYTLYYFYRKGDYWFLVWLTVKAGHGIISSGLDLWYCTFWIAIAVAVFHMEKGTRESLKEVESI